MSHEDIIRAWKDEEYRMSLSEEERAQLPDNPAGLIELTDAEMDDAKGGYGYRTIKINIPITRTRTSAVDACPSSLGCPWQRTINVLDIRQRYV